MADVTPLAAATTGEPFTVPDVATRLNDSVASNAAPAGKSPRFHWTVDPFDTPPPVTDAKVTPLGIGAVRTVDGAGDPPEFST